MRTYQVTKREGELLGPVDWSYDFTQGVRSMCSTEERKAERVKRYTALLREAEEKLANGEKIWVETSGFWHELLAVGMYDGWPYWKPTPALLYLGPLKTGEWAFYYDLNDVKVWA